MVSIKTGLAVGVLASSLLITMLPEAVKAENSAEVTGYITGQELNFSAGVHAAVSETIVMIDENEVLASEVTEHEAPVVAEGEIEEVQEQETVPVSEYANIAVTQVEIYLNIRAEANAEAEVLGKLYNNNAATVLETLDGWYKITSGNVTGYVSSDYVVVGNEELCKSVSKRVGTVTAEVLKFRNGASLDAGVHTLLANGKQVTVLDETIPGWYQVTDGNYTGYVSSDYVTVETRYSYAESKEEEAARLAAEAEARRQEAERQQAQAQAAASKTYNPPSGSDGQAVVDYAVQFVGNPYVWGGESLTNGADCSGFVKAVYAQFGVSLPRNSYGQRSAGYAVSVSEMQPGDIVCYSGHVGIYIGNGQIVHASNRSGGIKISNYNFGTVLAVRRIF